MKITDSRVISGLRGVTAQSPRPRAQQAAPAAAADTASVMGIPEAEFTPKVRAAIMNLMHEVGRFREELDSARRRIEHLEQLAEHDTLTPILNRRGFVREMTRVKSFVDRYSAPATLVFFDLNDFKPVNDRFGHAAGDQVLQRIAQVLVENTRDSDVIGRLGGDEFGVILVNTNADLAGAKAKRLAEAIGEQRFTANGEKYSVTASYGTYIFKQGDDPVQALARADEAMYASKRGRKPA